MRIQLSHEMLEALRKAKHIPPDVQKRIDTVKPEPGSPPTYYLQLTEDGGMELSELLQWHVRTDPATGRPTPDTEPYAAIIGRINEAGL